MRPLTSYPAESNPHSMSFSSASPPPCLKVSHASHLLDPQVSSILNRLNSCKSTRELKQIHSYIIKTSPTLQPQLLCPKLLSLCSKFPDIDLTYLHSLFTQISGPGVGLCNAIIRCFSGSKNKNGSLLVLCFYGELLAKGLIPDKYTYPFLLKACAESRALREGQEVHACVVKNGFVLDLYVVNTLIRLYAVCGAIESAQKTFDEGPYRDLVSWTTLIQGYVKMGLWMKGILLFFEMCDANFQVDELTAVIVISACAKLGDLNLGRRIHCYMSDHKVNFDVFVGNALIDMYLKCGDADSAHKIFNEMPVKNVVTWNSMISGLVQKGEFKEVLNMFRKMQRQGVKPDGFTIVGVLNSCANLGILELGKWVHAYADRNCLKADGFIGNALVDMYTKCGSIDEASKVFNGMKCRDVYTYTGMIVGLAMHGQGKRALDLFSQVPKKGIKPNGVTYLGVLMACCHAGLVEEGQKHFSEMSIVYNLEPHMEHYGCMVDLLGRAGLVNEAQEFISNMPIEPDALVWGALLGACRIHGNVELGEIVLEKLEKFEPERDGTYVLMSNIYFSANKRRKALKLRKAMKERDIRKIPGCSSIELDGVVHEFRKGDKSHRKTKDIYSTLDELTSHLQNSGQWVDADEFYLTDRGA